MLPSEQVPDGLEIRAASAEDAEVVAEIVNEVMVAETGVPWTTTEEQRDELTSPGRDPRLANVLLLERGGRAIGYVQFIADAETPGPVTAFVHVRPRLWGRGLNAWLMRLSEERILARSELEPAVLRVARFADNEPAERLFVALGYGLVRTFWMMRIALDSPPPVARVPDGIVIRTFEPGRDELPAYTALAEAFAEHWGGPFGSFEEWRHLHVDGEGSGFDPSLWFLATDGDEVVGSARCLERSPRSDDTAEVAELAVRAPWRRRGIGLAFLHTAFSEFHGRGIPLAELGVDAENATGATHLYERAGMHVAFSWEFWEKQLSG
jgi:mycothiol synthase